MRVWSIGVIRRITYTEGERDRDMPSIEINAVGDGHDHTAKIVVHGDTIHDVFIAEDIVAALNEHEAGRSFAVPPKEPL